MIDPQHLEEWAALHALGLLEEAERMALLEAAESDPAVRSMIGAFSESAALLAYDARPVAPPPALKEALMRQLPQGSVKTHRIISFPAWIPYALAACLMAIAIYQTNQVFALKSQLRSSRSEIESTRADLATLRERNNMTELRLASLEAKDPAYGSAKIMVAWDPGMHHGVVSMENMPPPPPGHSYQLWVLDPTAPAPISAGLITAASGSEPFAVKSMQTPGPGFAVSLEPEGGSAAPTVGSILFAVAPRS